MRELDHGAWEGRLLVELEADPEYQRWMRGPESTPIPGSVESATVAQQRAIEALRQVLGASSGEAVLVVAHKHVLALVMCALNGLPLSAFGDTVRDDFTPLELTIQQLERLRG
jgi:broad specificity phosphatase PhoE